MLVAAGVILETDIVALRIDEARLPIPCVQLRIVDRDDILELVADLANALGGDQLVAVRQPRRVEKGLIVEAVALYDERVAS
jgi:hypothetical protein